VDEHTGRWTRHHAGVRSYPSYKTVWFGAPLAAKTVTATGERPQARDRGMKRSRDVPAVKRKLDRTMLKHFFVGTVVIGCVCAVARADQGMWLFDHPPVEQVEASYGFKLTPQWLEHVQHASVRFNSGGSGSFVSSDGLTFTNHHVAQTCLQQVSTPERDLYKTGFYATTRAEELKCRDLELNALIGVTDVTARVDAGVTPSTPVAAAGRVQRANMARLESECQVSSDLRCQVVPLYSGGVFELYRYRKYTDVRLVFAPEFDVAFFGGDHDNFEFPRWDFDVAFFRVYEHDAPARLDDFFRWSARGIADGEPAFVSGHPGSTDRLATVAELEFLRDVSLPFSLEVGTRRDRLLTAWGARSPEQLRRAQESIFGIENNLKRNRVYDSSLSESAVMTRKRAEEDQLRDAVHSEGAAAADDPWAAIAHAMTIQREIYLPLQLIERRTGLPGDLAGFARTLVRAAVERQKPNAERLREYTDAALPSLEQTLFADTPVFKDLQELLLTDGLELLRERLPANPATKLALGGEPPAVVARRLIAGTHLDDPSVRRRLYAGGTAAIDKSDDPLIALMRAIDPEARQYRARYENEVASTELIEGGRIARQRFAESGFDVPPDATFTLRLSYGAVRGYTETGLGDIVPKGTHVEPFTRIDGLFERATRMGNAAAFHLPDRWVQARAAGRLNLSTPFNFVSTDDIIGGNSGSPVIDRAGEIVGIIFDGNMQSLVWRYVYDDAAGRAVSVDSRAVIEALRHVYNAGRLADELTGRTLTAR
jgi:hypothetical protein